MTTPGPCIRPVEPLDAAAVATLSGEFGYPTTTEAIIARLETIQRSRATQPAAVLVAEAGEGREVVGWVHVCMPVDLVKADTADIWGLVVAASHRGQGIGRALMAAAEEWASGQGCREIRLRSGSHREGAHAFYRRIGYRVTKSQLTFARDLHEPR